MSIRASAACLMVACACIAGNAGAQHALASEYGYKLVGAIGEESYFLSGIRRGAEPESVEAWIWIVPHHAVTSDGDSYDARAQWSIMRCTGKTIEAIRTEYYLNGEFLKVVETPPKTPVDVKPETPMLLAWKVACDMDTRFSAKTLPDLVQVYQAAHGS